MATQYSSSQISDHQLAGEWSAEIPSNLTVLLVGDGNFGFSYGLVNSRKDGSKIVATSFQTNEGVITMYKDAAQNIGYLLSNGARVLFEVDARTMKNHPKLTRKRFDRIIFNFPHAGFVGAETDPKVIEAHRALMRPFFKNAATMLTPNGEVHVTHQTNSPYNKWNLPQLANDAGLDHFETCAFDIKDYPGYENKRGAGRDGDKPFNLGETVKFKFKKIM